MKKNKYSTLKKTASLLVILMFIFACDDLEEALASTSCYCEDATSYYPATILTECETGYSFECYPLGEEPS